MQRDILPHVIFSPARLALGLAEGLQGMGVQVTLFTPGPVDTTVKNNTADLRLFKQELTLRGDTYLDLLKKHPLTFISLARQVQSELIAQAFALANRGDLDIVHIYTNEEDIALPFAALCRQPVVFTHHDPFNFLVRYKSVFPRYPELPFIALSEAQKTGLPNHNNWAATIYHGLDPHLFTPNYQPKGDYLAYLGRIIAPKGVHLAIQAVKAYNATAPHPLSLKIAGKHYAGEAKDTYWQQQIEPFIDHREIIYEGFIGDDAAKQDFLGNARALIIPSIFDEPFGVVMIEALACGTPVIGLDSGAIGEVIRHGHTGMLVPKEVNPDTRLNESATVNALAEAITQAISLNRQHCRDDFEQRFTLERMCAEHLSVYQKILQHH